MSGTPREEDLGKPAHAHPDATRAGSATRAPAAAGPPSRAPPAPLGALPDRLLRHPGGHRPGLGSARLRARGPLPAGEGAHAGAGAPPDDRRLPCAAAVGSDLAVR